MTKTKVKVGILTWHYYTNPGSALQCYALQTMLQTLGYNTHVINYRSPKFGICKGFKFYIKNILFKFTLLTPALRKIVPNYNIIKFQRQYLKQTSIIQTNNKLTSTIQNYQTIIYGSDQIWAPNVFNPVYMGAYIPKNVKKIAYAASIGLNDIPDSLIPKYRTLLSTFHAISVREKQGQELLKEKCDINATVVLDPTLMIDIKMYQKMQKKVRISSKPYIFCYFLNKDHKYKDQILRYATIHQLNIIGISDAPHDGEWMYRLQHIGADQFIWLINHASVVFTDSYHGAIFSLIFHKSLWIFKRFADNNPICQNSRIDQLTENFNIRDRIISPQEHIIDTSPIDYQKFEEKLRLLQKQSYRYLINALK